MASIRFTVVGDYDPGNSFAENFAFPSVYTNVNASYSVVLVPGAQSSYFYFQNNTSTAFDALRHGSSITNSSDYSISADFSDNIGSVRLTGGDRGDVLLGGAGNDVLRGGAGGDTLNGGAGDDTIEGGTGGNQIDGGSGVNTLSYANLPVDAGGAFGAYVDLQDGFSLGNEGLFGDSIANIQNVIGTSVNDTLLGDGEANVFEGGAGADYIDGRGGNDTASYEHSSAGVTVNLTTNVNTGGDAAGDDIRNMENITGSAFADSLTGDAGANRLDGLAGADLLRGGDGDDTLNGGAGNDTIEGGAGFNQIDGGSGVNTLSYASLSPTPGEGAVVDLQLGSAWALGGFLGDTISNIQNLIGTSVGDAFYGNGAANIFEGGAGADIFEGRGGSDTVSYEHSAAGVTVNLATNVNTGGDAEGDVFFDAIENISGSRYADSLTGDANANRLNGYAGADTLTGGDGADVYIVRDARVVVVEQAGEGTDRVEATVNHTLAANVENLTLITNAINGTGNDIVNVITGSARANVIDGKGGSDVLYGKGGADTFSFSTELSNGNVDRIVDFDGDDTIQLDRTIFSQFSAGDLSDDLFKNLDLGKQDANDKILYDQDTGRLFYDADGKGGEAAKLFALIGNHADLDASDFRII